MIKKTAYILLLLLLLLNQKIISMQNYDQQKILKQPQSLVEHQNKTKACRNLILLLDPEDNESLEKTVLGPLTSMFFKALAEEAAPIIITKNFTLLLALLKSNRKKEIYDKLMGPDQSALKNILNKINLSDEHWQCYNNMSEDLLLFIPKKYISRSTQAHDVFKQIEACGFNKSELRPISPVSPNLVWDAVSKRNMPIYYKNLPDKITSLLLEQPANKEPSYSWNIYLSGHGEPSVPHTENTGLIAGLKVDNFSNLMSLFNNKINTSYLHYTSCFAGGFNQTLINEQLKKLNVKFIVSTIGTNESTVPDPFIKKTETSFTHFFELLNSFFCSQAPINPTEEESLEQTPIASILKTIIDPSDYTQPFVRLPKLGVFNALSIDRKVKILTNSIANDHKTKNETLNFTSPEIQTIIVYPNHINAPVHIKGHTAIVSPTPQDMTAQKQTIHIFEEMTYDDILSSMIPNFVSFNSSYTPITFVIKKLHCFNYAESGLLSTEGNKLEIENMIIEISGKASGKNNLNVTVNVIFDHNKRTYSLFKEIEYLQELNAENRTAPNIYRLFEKFAHLEAKPLQKSDENSSAVQQQVDLLTNAAQWPVKKIQPNLTYAKGMPRSIIKIHKKSAPTWYEYFSFKLQALWKKFFNQKKRTRDQDNSIVLSDEPYTKPR